MKPDKPLEEVIIEKLVHGGQGLGTLQGGRKVFLWNALPGERVRAELWRRKKNWAEGVAREILQASPVRQEPREANFLATSPWQILNLAAENSAKADIVRELFAGEGLELPQFEIWSDGREWAYRNKMEYSFWGDDEGVHLALYNRGSHQKSIVQGSALALPAIDTAANAIVAELNRLGVRAGDLKTVVLRASQKEAVAALFVKTESLPKLNLPEGLKGLRVYYSNPKSPASVPTRALYTLGEIELEDKLLGKRFRYDVDSFFQVNLPVFAAALGVIKDWVGPKGKVVDMYSGAGTIGLSLGNREITLVELDRASAAMARKNGPNVTIIEASTETVLDAISKDATIIFDPPRAGLHKKVVQRITEVKPATVIYLSCKPATQARDLGLLKDHYEITGFKGYNFFPHTPHIETLALLKLRAVQ